MGRDEAPADGALPARAALPAAHADRDRLAARGDGCLARAADPDRRAPSTRSRASGTATSACSSSPSSRSASSASPAPTRRPTSRAGRGAHARRPAQPSLPPPAAAVARVLRAQPRRRPDQPADERRRGARPARHRRRHLADPEHAHARRRRGDPLRPLVEARARDAHRHPGARGRDRDLPQEVGPLLPARPRDARQRDGDTRRGHRRHARPAGVHPRARGPARTSGASARPTAGATGRRSIQNAVYFPFVDLLSSLATAIILGYGGLPRLRRADDDRRPHRVPRVRDDVLRPGAAALAALQHVPLRRRGARQDHGGARRGAAGDRRRRRGRRSAGIRGHVRFDDVHFSYGTGPRCCTGSTSTCRPAPRSPSSATPAPASRRSRS